MATLVITATPDRLLKLAQRIAETAHEASSGLVSITLDNGVTNSVASVTGTAGKRRDS